MSETRDAAWYQKSAERFNRAEAQRFPLLAAMGAIRTYTGEERQAEAEAARVASEQHWAEVNQRLTARAAEFRARVSALISAEDLARLDAYCAAQAWLTDPAYLAEFWAGVERRVQGGGPPLETWTPEAERPRATVEPDVAHAALVAACGPVTHTMVADAIGAPILDTITAVLCLRDSGRAVPVLRHGKFRGWAAA